MSKDFALRYVPEQQTVTCGWCGVVTEVAAGGSPLVEASIDGPGGSRVYKISGNYRCPRYECGRQSLLYFEVRPRSGMLEGYQVDFLGQLPRGRAEDMRGLPQAIADVRNEAWSCFYGGDYRAALVMGRAAVQRGVRTLGGEGRDLYTEIESLRERGIVTTELVEWAHDVRLAAREAAHPEELGDVLRDEAETSLEFADAFLRFAIALPAQRAAKKASAADHGASTGGLSVGGADNR